MAKGASQLRAAIEAIGLVRVAVLAGLGLDGAGQHGPADRLADPFDA
jgi:hypothetical protein